MTYQQLLTLLKDTALMVNPKGRFTNARKPDGTFDFEPPYPIINLRSVTKKTNRREGLISYNITLLFFRDDSISNPVSVMEANQFMMDEIQDAFMNILYSSNRLQIENETAIPENRIPGGKVSGFGVNFNLITRPKC
jgi:hypothetical protein